MKYLDDLPKRHSNHIIESKAVVAFEKILDESECFMIQQKDTQDYGTDCQIDPRQYRGQPIPLNS